MLESLRLDRSWPMGRVLVLYVCAWAWLSLCAVLVKSKWVEIQRFWLLVPEGKVSFRPSRLQLRLVEVSIRFSFRLPVQVRKSSRPPSPCLSMADEKEAPCVILAWQKFFAFGVAEGNRHFDQ